MRLFRIVRRGLLIFLLVVAASGTTALFKHQVQADWWSASREPMGVAPDPAIHREAIVQVYGARAFKWRGYFGIHTWIAVKPSDAPRFTIYEVVGWRAYRGGNAVVTSSRAPDSRWFGAEPDLLADLRGDGVDEIIEDIQAAVASYPYKDRYSVWPGPNSNTFTAHVVREVSGLGVDFPPTAIGKDYVPISSALTTAPSGTGVQFSLLGLLGVIAGADEGLEVNILGLSFGVDILDPALKLPLAGRLGSSSVTTE